jgi:potassium channel subfamily K
VKVLKRVILDHIGQQQDKGRPNYSFEDWEYIFYLLGALEPSLPEEENLSALDGVQSLAPKSSLEKRGARKRMIDWLHCKNPLNATETLTEWILLTLVEKLEWELLVLRRKTGNTSTD